MENSESVSAGLTREHRLIALFDEAIRNSNTDYEPEDKDKVRSRANQELSALKNDIEERRIKKLSAALHRMDTALGEFSSLWKVESHRRLVAGVIVAIEENSDVVNRMKSSLGNSDHPGDLLDLMLSKIKLMIPGNADAVLDSQDGLAGLFDSVIEEAIETGRQNGDHQLGADVRRFLDQAKDFHLK